MARVATQEGEARFKEFTTWYRITGDLDAPRLPLVIAHGGPGFTHDYLDVLRQLVETGQRAVVHYDQIGNGQSTHLSERSQDFWTVELFVAELENLLQHLGISLRYALLGHSWGGMLAAEHAVRRPRGLKALILANAAASMDLWLKSVLSLRSALPRDVQETLERHEKSSTIDAPDYQAATGAFFDRHVCRLKPYPSELLFSLEAMTADPTVFNAMYGPSIFQLRGTLRTWTVIDRLDQIDAPTLVLRGAHDEADESCSQPFADKIPDVETVVFRNSSHLPHVEERDVCLDSIKRFLELRDSCSDEPFFGRT